VERLKPAEGEMDNKRKRNSQGKSTAGSGISCWQKKKVGKICRCHQADKLEQN